jgi:hypothetical protein
MAKKEITEIVFTGSQIVWIVSEAEAINEWNSVRAWFKGQEINMGDLKLVFYNENQEEEK